MPTIEAWRDRLVMELDIRQGDIAKRRRYYDGHHPRPTVPDTENEAFKRLADLAVTNVMALIVDTVNERCIPRDVRLSDDEQENLRVWRDVWQRNALDADCRVVHEEALKVGRSFVLVWPDDDDDDGISITPEDPADCIVAYKPGSRRVRLAALKRWSDDPDFGNPDVRDIEESVTLWTPDRVQTWRRASKSKPWVDATDFGTGSNPLGIVPMVEFLCKPSITGKPAPEVSDSAIVLQQRINKTAFDAVVAGEYGAFPQRVAIGIEIEMEFKEINGEKVAVPKNPLKTGPNRVWALKQAERSPHPGSVQQLPPFPTSDLLRQIDAWMKQLASITQTPVYHLMSGADNIGAEFLKRLESAHISKIRAHQVTFGERWEEVIALALRAGGQQAPPDIELGWMPAEASSPIEQGDQASKLAAAGFDEEFIARRLGESPSEIDRMTPRDDAA